MSNASRQNFDGKDYVMQKLEENYLPSNKLLYLDLTNSIMY